jgi:hypothetical protein
MPRWTEADETLLEAYFLEGMSDEQIARWLVPARTASAIATKRYELDLIRPQQPKQNQLWGLSDRDRELARENLQKLIDGAQDEATSQQPFKPGNLEW